VTDAHGSLNTQQATGHPTRDGRAAWSDTWTVTGRTGTRRPGRAAVGAGGRRTSALRTWQAG